MEQIGNAVLTMKIYEICYKYSYTQIAKMYIS